MGKSGGFLNRLTDLGEPLPELPIVELAGDNRVLIENHRGIVQYTGERIGVRVKYGLLLVCGCRLHLACMTRERLVISGRIDGIHLERRERS